MSRRAVLTPVALSLALVGGLAACSSDADVASKNLSKDADNFKVARKVTLYNGISDTFIASVEGYCSLGNDDKADRVSVVCKVGGDTYTKDIFVKSDNTFVFAQQLYGQKVSTDHYKVIVNPSLVIPDVDAR